MFNYNLPKEGKQNTFFFTDKEHEINSLLNLQSRQYYQKGEKKNKIIKAESLVAG